MDLRLTINGAHHTIAVDPRLTLLDLLREELGLTGTKRGCDAGQCGACTVLVDGRRILACLQLAATVDGEVATIEGLSEGSALHPMQQAFLDHDAYQCGYCTPGQIMSAVGCFNEGRYGSEAEISETMSGNLCRCAAYPAIGRAVAEGCRRMEML